jgi:hypothetical protein
VVFSNFARVHGYLQDEAAPLHLPRIRDFVVSTGDNLRRTMQITLVTVGRYKIIVFLVFS